MEQSISFMHQQNDLISSSWPSFFQFIRTVSFNIFIRIRIWLFLPTRLTGIIYQIIPDVFISLLKKKTFIDEIVNMIDVLKKLFTLKLLSFLMIWQIRLGEILKLSTIQDGYNHIKKSYNCSSQILNSNISKTNEAYQFIIRIFSFLLICSHNELATTVFWRIDEIN